MTEKDIKKKEMTLGFLAVIYGTILLLVITSETVYFFKTDGSDGWFYSLHMFTNQSNFFIAVWFACYGVTRFIGQESKFSKFVCNRILITVITVYITITFLVVAFVLAPIYKGHFIHGIDGALLFTHLVTPIVMWIYFFLVQGNGNLKYRHAWYILAYPICYALVNLLLGAVLRLRNTAEWLIDSESGDWVYIPGEKAYAYDFLNPYCYPNMFLFVLTILGLATFFGLLGMCLIKFKRYLVKTFY